MGAVCVEMSPTKSPTKRRVRSAVRECPPTPVKSPAGRMPMMDWSDDEEDGEGDVAMGMEKLGSLGGMLPPRFPDSGTPEPRTPDRMRRQLRMSMRSPGTTPLSVRAKRRLDPASKSEGVLDALRSPFRHSPPPRPNTNPFSPDPSAAAGDAGSDAGPERPQAELDTALTVAAKQASLNFSKFAGSVLGDSTIGSCFSEDDGDLNALLKPSRYHDDFEEIDEIGKGSFGRVFKCQKRLDGWMYAVKCSNRKIRGRGEMQDVLREVYAMAALGNNPHVVRYFSAWIEDEALYIQTELIESGSLASRVKSGELEFGSEKLREMLRQLAIGLNQFHERRLIHLDIKPENLYLTQDGIYKIGDFGLTVRSDRGTQPVEVAEGDARYLAAEVLAGTATDLTKADIFALGLSAYELCRREPLPFNGKEWHQLRQGGIEPIPGVDAELLEVMQRMTDPDPSRRPSAAELLLHPALHRRGDAVLLEELGRERSRRLEVEALLQNLDPRVKRVRTEAAASE